MTGLIILGGIIATYAIGGQFVTKDGQSKPAWHFTWPVTLFKKIKKAI